MGAGYTPGRLKGGLTAFERLSGCRGPPPAGRTDNPSWVASWSTWLQCRAGRWMANPYGALWPCVLRDSGVADFTIATPGLVTVMWVLSWRVQSWPLAESRSSCGRLLGVGLLVAGFLESAFFSGRFQGRAAFQQSSCEMAGQGKAASCFGCLMARSA